MGNSTPYLLFFTKVGKDVEPTLIKQNHLKLLKHENQDPDLLDYQTPRSTAKLSNSVSLKLCHNLSHFNFELSSYQPYIDALKIEEVIQSDESVESSSEEQKNSSEMSSQYLSAISETESPVSSSQSVSVESDDQQIT